MSNPFGQAADYSGVFASLGREDIAAVASATRRAAGQAADDQNAADQDTYSKWKAGQISDGQWLDYIRARLKAAGGDPEDQQKWADMLRTNEAAISDSQVETQFRLGKISAATLLSHYRKRMTGVATDSPAYRDLAERYQQVVEYSRGGSSGSGGGSGGGSGHSLAKYIDAQKGKSTSASGYDQTGENVIDPASNYYGIGTVDYYLKTLEADKDRMKDLVDQYKANPRLTELIDHMTGQRVPVTPEFLHAIDNQYLRNQDSIATVYDAKGNPKLATAARTEKGTYISTYMVDHNTDRIEPAYSAFQKTMVAMFKGASDLPPDQALSVYAQAGKMVKSFINGSFPGEEGVGLRQYLGQNVTNKATQELGVAGQDITAELPPELTSSAALWESLNGWENLIQSVNNPALSDEERQFYADEAIRLIPGSVEPTTQVGVRGERDRLSEENVRDILYGDPNIPSRSTSDKSPLGPTFTGAFAKLEQREGLDNRDPSYDGQRFVYSVAEDGTPHVVPGKSWPNVDGSISLTPLDTVDRSSLIRTAFKVGTATHIGYATAQVIPPNLLPKEALVYRAVNNVGTVSAGGLLPSDVIAKMGMDGLKSLIRQGAVVADSPFRGVVIRGEDGPIIYYQDPKTGFLSTTIDPKMLELDGVTGGVHVSVDDTDIAQADINDIPFAKGSPIAFGDGFSRKDMIAVTREQIASGQLDPGEFSVRGAGTSVAGAATAEDIIRGFGPPTMAELGQATMAAHNAWGRGHAAKGFDTQTAQEQKEWQDNLRAARASDGRTPHGLNPVQDVVDSISNFAGQMGVQIRSREPLPDLAGNRPEAPQQDLGALARNDAMDAMRARQAAMNRPKNGLQPIFTPPPVSYAPLPVRERDTGALGPLPKINPVPVIAAPKVGQGRYKGKNLGGY